MDKNYFTPPVDSPPQEVRSIISGLLQNGMPEIPSDLDMVESLKSRQDDPRCAAELEALLARLKEQGLPLSPIDEVLQTLREHPRYAADFAATLAAAACSND